MLVLIDSDTLCYASAAMAEGLSAGIARSNVDNGLRALLLKLNNPEYECWVTGDTNFRHNIYPEYKANRLKTPRPTYLAECKQHLVNYYGAQVSEGCEADDMLGVEQMTYSNVGVETMISSIDKDLDMIPGWHYSPELTRLGVTIKPARQYIVSPLDAIRFFYYQMLIGDPTDNIKGVPGIGKVNASKLLEEGHTEQDWFTIVRKAYDCDEQMEMNGKVLWLWRKMNDIWNLKDIEQRLQGVPANQTT